MDNGYYQLFLQTGTRPFICWQSKRRSVNSRPMPDKLVTRGLVLRATETKEADYILTVLTGGARTARRHCARSAAALEQARRGLPAPCLFRAGALPPRSWHYLDEALDHRAL